MDEVRRKILAGSQLRRLRSQLSLSQTAMAAELGISTSYLNLVERNQRPLTAQLLIRLSQTYSVDPHTFAGTEDAQAATELEEILGDPLLAPLGVPRAEVRAALEETPTLVAALRRLHAAWQGLAETGASEGVTERGEAARRSAAGEAIEQVRAVLEREANHFPALEVAAEGIAEGVEAERGAGLLAACARRLRDRHGVRLEVQPAQRLRVTLSHYDRHRRRLLLSELLAPSGRTFQAAVQLALLEAGGAIDATLTATGLNGSATQRLGRVTLANYVAAAIVMPYEAVLAAAQETAYDVELIGARFGASWEQVAHRLTTLGRPAARGVPFFMLRVDRAGNVSKRFSSGQFPFSRMGGTCPRWNIHAAFETPGRAVTQLIELTDGKPFLSVARTVRRLTRAFNEPDATFVVALGCEARFAPQLCYGQGLRGTDPTGIGVNCRLCDRPACPSRAAPALSAPLEVSEATRGLSPFGF